MTSQDYFDNFLQLGDEIRIVSSNPHLKGFRFQLGSVTNIFYEDGIAIVNVNGHQLQLTPDDFEPVNPRIEARTIQVEIRITMNLDDAERFMHLYKDRNVEFLEALRALKIRKATGPWR